MNNVINLTEAKVKKICEKTIENLDDDIEQIHLEILNTTIDAEGLKRIGQLGDALRYAEAAKADFVARAEQ